MKPEILIKESHRFCTSPFKESVKNWFWAIAFGVIISILLGNIVWAMVKN